MKKFLLSALFGSILLMSTPLAYGHGLGLDTIRSINVGDRKLNVTVQIIPTTFEESVEKKIIVTTSDAVTNINLDNVTMLIGLYHDGNLVFEDHFFADDGKIIINVRPTESEAKIVADWNREVGAWYAVESNPAELVGNAFTTGGLYHFEIILESINDSGKGLANMNPLVADVTLTTSHFYDQKDGNGNTVKFGIKSYYDEISSFKYDSDAKVVTFEMPFDWTEQNISHVQVVHEEVHFPKEFEEFFAPSYVGKLNGIELFKSSITIDDYTSEDQRIVHFVLSQDNLRYLKQAQKSSGIDPHGMVFMLEPNDELVFPVVAMTRDESIQVDLSWDPVIIEPNKNTKFIYTFRDAKTGDLIRNTSYDFVILQNGKELYKKSAIAQIGSDFADYTFSELQKGPTSIRFENIGGTGKQTEFAITVVPEFGQLALVVLSFAVAASLVGTRLRA